MSEEEVLAWYPQFGLKDNPFKFSDYRTEKDYHAEYKYVPTKVAESVVSHVRSGTSVFILGDRGCGKSAALAQAAENSKMPKDTKEAPIFMCLGPARMSEIYDKLCTEICLELWNDECTNELLDEASDYWEWMANGEYKSTCAYPLCRRKRRCKFKGRNELDRERTKEGRAELIWMQVNRVEGICGLKREFVHQFVGIVSKKWVFLLDAPDDLVETGAIYFKNLIEKLLRCGVVVIMATREQYEKCKQLDALARLSAYEFNPPLSVRMLKEVYKSRLEVAQYSSPFAEQYSLPFADEVLNYLASECRGNPRTFIQCCDVVLKIMEKEARKEPADMEFAEKCLLPLRPRVTVAEALNSLAKSYIETKRGLVEVREIQKDLKDRYGLEMNAKSLGRELTRMMKKGLILDHKYRPYSAYRFT